MFHISSIVGAEKKVFIVVYSSFNWSRSDCGSGSNMDVVRMVSTAHGAVGADTTAVCIPSAINSFFIGGDPAAFLHFTVVIEREGEIGMIKPPGTA